MAIDREVMDATRASALALAAKVKAGTATAQEKDDLLVALAYIALGEEAV